MRPIITPTPINKIPEITFVITIAFGEDKNDLVFARNNIINILPIIGIAKDVPEITKRSTEPISEKLKKLGNNVK